MNRIGKFIMKRAAVTSYFIAVRKKENFAFEYEGKSKFTIIKNPSKSWLADPIPFEKDGETYLFYEVYPDDTRKGCIGMMKYDEKDGKFKNHHIVIEEPFHMSFPHIFTFKDSIYMIPETNAAKQIRIYRAGRDMSDWSLYKSFETEAGYSDIVTKIVGETIFICCTQKGDDPLTNKLHLFKIKNLDSESTVMEEIDINKDEFLHNIRNGGSIFDYKGESIRVIQRDDEGIYGSGIIFRKINAFDEKGFDESEDYKTIGTGDIAVNLSRHKYELMGIHTYCVTDKFEIIDILVQKISLRLFFKHYIRLMKGEKY